MEQSKDKAKGKGQGSRKLFRSRSLKSVGDFVHRILKTISHLSHMGEARNEDGEDDDGGFNQKGMAQEDSRVVHGGDSNNNLGKAQVPVLGQDRISWSSDDKVPGVQGMKNHGNTCFMNAVVQCLSNTDMLAEFLGMERYKAQLNKAKINGVVVREATAEPPGAAGEVTERLASLVRGLWTLEYTPQLSAEFKNVVSKYGSQFRGNSQHDALEFLLWLLDRVHEDLNPTSSQKAKPSAKAGAEQNQMVHPQSPELTGGSQSFVQEHFQAQYRSSLTCPHCHRQSDTFDPFLCVSLPLPLRQTRALNLTLVFQTKQQRFLRVGLAVPLLGTVASLRKMVADEGNMAPDQVILVELYPSGFQRSFSDDEDLNTIAEGDPVYAFQAPVAIPKASGSSRSSVNEGLFSPLGHPRSLPSSPRYPDPEAQKFTGAGSKSSDFLADPDKILLLLCNTEGSGKQANRFGPPLLVREDSTMSWDQLQQCILGKLRYLLKNESHLQNGTALLHVRVVGGPASGSYLNPKDPQPLQHPAIDRALKLSGAGGPPHVKLAIEWDPKTKERLFGNIQEEVVQDDESVRIQQLEHQQQNCTLDECFQLYTKEEQLAPDDAWRCPYCKVLQQGTVKLSLWTLPDILIIHLKRFRQVGGRRNKLSTLVRFPLTGLDMAPHVVKRSQGSKGMLGQWSSWKQTHASMENGQLDVHYDLYGVCNHHGSLQGGHYTAYCRNSLDARWYSYDDSNVEHVQENDVCTRGAYLLFYQKRTTIPMWSASSSVRGSTSSSVSDHWILRLNGSRRESLASRATTNNCPNRIQPPDSPVFLEKEVHPEKGASGSKSFVRGVKGRSASMKLPSASKLKLSISKAMPLRWSFGSKDRAKRETGELVEYLESGRRPKYTNESIVPLMAGLTKTEKGVEGQQPKANLSKTQVVNGAAASSPSAGHSKPTPSFARLDSQMGKPKEKDNLQESTLNVQMEKGVGSAMLKRRETRSAGDCASGMSSPDPEYGLKGTVLLAKKGESKQRNLIKNGNNIRAKPSEAEGQQDGKSTNLKSSLVKKEIRRQSGTENSSGMDLSNGMPRTSIDNAILGDGRTSSTMTRQHREDLTKIKLQQDMRRAHSSSNVQNKADFNLKRSVSLYRNGSASQQPSRQVAAEKYSTGSLQRLKYNTSSTGRKKSVPESSF
ncbi:ubiquitin carboxyl-terminal hydrolase 43 isoform X2 [Xenopus laevis]|uniref:ubiquitinyl hydrolase 1 n=1 Tax=Xenopus laevis TaxID=8355 RepID=A0A8J0TVC5_XENLA|nr:ubiquitin carboxyl-terminal hydrolase 43 isoform X2 [Xenopus laevis]